ncbi:MAG TPA: class I SAM-dependent methyltransferase [Candidatus Elarobacter sp.]|nr:class I SAM-dependent methyltransferase [Candidatus Elarobacter sp.]
MRRLPALDPRLPDWTNDLNYERPCPFCGNDETDPLFERPDQSTVHGCDECGCRFIKPAVSPSRLRDFYSTYTEHARWRQLDERWLEELANHDATLDDPIRRLVTYGPFGRVLDVGSGSGRHVAAFLSLGAEVVALDPNPAARAVAQALGAEAIAEPLEACDFEGAFDAVLLHDLVEHPLDPLPLLRAAYRALRPGGVLSVWTPNGASRHDADGAGPTVFRVDLEHMQWLTPLTVTRLAHELGAEIAHLEVEGQPDLAGFGLSAVADSGARAPGLARRLGDAWDLAVHGRTRRIAEPLGDYHVFAILRHT